MRRNETILSSLWTNEGTGKTLTRAAGSVSTFLEFFSRLIYIVSRHLAYSAGLIFTLSPRTSKCVHGFA